MSYVGANPKFTTQLYRPQSADPSNPAEGMVFRSDGTSRSKGLWEYREGNWQRFGSDAKTYIANYNIDSSTTSWATYADAAGAVPVDGTGGSPTTTFTFSSSSPLRGSGSGIITKDAANRQGEGISTDFTIDTADQGKVLQLSFDFTTSSAFVAADYRVFLYDVTNSLLIEGNARDLQANAGYGLYIGNFQTSSNSTSYRLILHCATTNASAYTIKVDNFILSPSQVSQGAIVTDWQSSTPTIGFTGGTLSTSSMYSRRNGDSLEVRVALKWSSIFTGGTPTFTLPSGLSIDVSKIPGTPASPQYFLGRATLNDVTNVPYYAAVAYNNSTSVILKPEITVGGNTFGAVTSTSVSTTYPFTWANNDEIFLEYSVPIVGWSSSITVPSQQTNQVIAFKARLSANQSLGGSLAKVTFDTVTGSTMGCFNKGGGFSTSNTRFEAPEAGTYCFNFVIISNTDLGSGSAYTSQIRKNGTSVKNFRMWADEATAQYSGTATIDLLKGDYVEVYAAGDTSWTAIGGDSADSAVFEGWMVKGNQTIGMDEVVAATYSTNAGQAIANTTNVTVLFEDKLFDTHNAYNTSTGEYTIPVAGNYLINSSCVLIATTNWNIAEAMIGRLQKNGSVVAETKTSLPATSASSIEVSCPPMGIVLSCIKGDLIKMSVYQSTGAGQNLTSDGNQNYFSIQRVK